MTCEHPTMLKAKLADKNKDIELDNNQLAPYCCLKCGKLFFIYPTKFELTPEFEKILKDAVKEWKKHLPHT
jgi:hypothetical protein